MITNVLVFLYLIVAPVWALASVSRKIFYPILLLPLLGIGFVGEFESRSFDGLEGLIALMWIAIVFLALFISVLLYERRNPIGETKLRIAKVFYAVLLGIFSVSSALLLYSSFLQYIFLHPDRSTYSLFSLLKNLPDHWHNVTFLLGIVLFGCFLFFHQHNLLRRNHSRSNVMLAFLTFCLLVWTPFCVAVSFESQHIFEKTKERFLAQQFSQEGNLSGCESLKRVMEKDECMLHLALAKGDPHICKKMQSRSDCPEKIAIHLNDVSLCRMAGDSQDLRYSAREACVINYAVHVRDSSFCARYIEMSDFPRQEDDIKGCVNAVKREKQRDIRGTMSDQETIAKAVKDKSFDLCLAIDHSQHFNDCEFAVIKAHPEADSPWCEKYITGFNRAQHVIRCYRDFGVIGTYSHDKGRFLPTIRNQ